MECAGGSKQTLANQTTNARVVAMVADSIQAEVIEFVAGVAEVKPERVTLDARLLDDLGIDGDDAVEFFNAVHERFGTDLTHLYERWSDHFGPEGVPLSAGLVILAAAVIGGLTFSHLDDVVGNVIAVAAAAMMAALFIVVSIWIGRKLGLIEDVTPITVREVVQAVEAGAWPR
jgi:acyl carrier protein